MSQQWKFPGTRFWGMASALGLMGALGCSQEPTAQEPTTEPAVPTADLPQVVATTSVLCDLTEQIAQATIALTCLMEPGQDPHTYQVKPSDRQAIDGSDLVLYDGYGYAPAIIDLVQASTTSAPKVAIFEQAVPTPLMGQAHDHDHGEEDHAHGEEDHAHGEEDHGHSHDEAAAGTAADGEGAETTVADPHIWHDAQNNGAIAAAIAAQLATVNPDRSDLYQDNAATLAQQFEALDGWIRTQVETIPAANRKLVTTHDSFRYFAQAYGVEVAGALSGLSTEVEPSAATLTELVEQVKAAKTPAIFAENTTNPELINTVANNAGVKVAEQPLFVEGPGGPDSAAATVQAMLAVNTCTIVNALGGTCSEASAPL